MPNKFMNKCSTSFVIKHLKQNCKEIAFLPVKININNNGDDNDEDNRVDKQIDR